MSEEILSVLRIFPKSWTLFFDGFDSFQIFGKFVNNPDIFKKVLKDSGKRFLKMPIICILNFSD